MKQYAALMIALCIGNALAATEAQWEAEIHCPSRVDKGLRSLAYDARYQVAVRGTKVMLKREREVVEVLAGEIEDGRLELKGAGFYKGDPDNKHWDLQANGAFPDGATSYEARVQMTRDGRGVRECKLKMAQTPQP